MSDSKVYRRRELVKRIMEEMEREGFTQGEAEEIPELLAERIKSNSERFIKEKPFAIYRD